MFAMTLNWQQKDRELCWHPFTQHGLDSDFLPVVAAKGAWLELADGRRLLDAISSWWACLHGHGHPELVEAIRAQAEKLDHVLFAGCTHQAAVQIAEDLIEFAAPLAHDDHRLSRVFFSDNGSTAVEVALKAAYQSWVRRGEPQRTLFLSLEGSYHGDTIGTMSLAEPEPFFSEFGPFLFEVVRVPACADALELAMQANANRIAGFILEPMIQGAAGMKMHSASFVAAARKLCDQFGVYLIADEVMTGFCRTGKTFAMEHAGVCPDLMALSKGLTSGTMPLAVTLVSEQIYSAFLSDERSKAFFHGHTFCANPIGCAVASASADLIRRENTPQKLTALGERISQGVSKLAELLPDGAIADLRHLGGVVAIEFNTSLPGSGLGADDPGYLSSLGDHLRDACKAHPNVLLRPLGNVIYAMPPACTTMAEADIISSAMCEVSLQAWKAARVHEPA
jgi:adenosylmethionine---8-amino-7-oxononanoate aminotransferase